MSLATGRYVSTDNPYVRVEDPTEQVVPEFPSRNNYRMPPYHRLDLGFVYKFRPGHERPGHERPRRGERDITFNVTNAYNRPNPYLISYQAQEDSEENPTGTFRARATTLFPLLPSVTYNFRF